MKKKTLLNKLFESRLFWLIFSLLLSMFLWFFVASTENYQDDVTINNVPVVFVGEDTLRESKSLIVTDAGTASISLTLSGNRSAIAKLNNTTVQAQIDLSTITRADTYDRGYQIVFTNDVSRSDIDVTWRSASIVSFTIDKLTSKMVDVMSIFTGTLAEDYIEDTKTVEPTTVKITGAKSELDKISHALVTVERQDVSTSIEDYFNYELVDEGGQPVDYYTIEREVEEVLFKMPIRMMKEVELGVTMTAGGGATDANCYVVESSPDKIAISGDPELIKDLHTILVGKIDLASFAMTKEAEFSIEEHLPEGVRNESGEKTVTFKFQIVGLETKFLTVTNFTLTNIPAGYEPESVTKSLDVCVRAPTSILELIEPEHIRVVVDLSAETAGTNRRYKASVTVDGFSEAGIVNISEEGYEIVVTLRRDE